ncbi:Plug domain-containing protein [uncultured Croceitalea sp.]|uniref:Plug domain-containing protein n=1 Tax=uncultured Croceitalea sp. TaxID=1798908 RepID=UPI00330623C2
MKKIYFCLSVLSFLAIASCSSTKNAEASNLKEELTQKNRGNVTLLNQIRQLPGITLQGGVPVLNKTANTINSFDNPEPLYILNDYIIGSSFRSVDQLVDNFNIKKIELLTGADASFYGTRGSKGVIKITTL